MLSNSQLKDHRHAIQPLKRTSSGYQWTVFNLELTPSTTMLVDAPTTNAQDPSTLTCAAEMALDFAVVFRKWRVETLTVVPTSSLYEL